MKSSKISLNENKMTLIAYGKVRGEQLANQGHQKKAHNEWMSLNLQPPSESTGHSSRLAQSYRIGTKHYNDLPLVPTQAAGILLWPGSQRRPTFILRPLICGQVTNTICDSSNSEVQSDPEIIVHNEQHPYLWGLRTTLN